MGKLSLFYPVKPNNVNQGFGVNGAYYQAHGINILGHNGIDFAATHGQPVYATHDGMAYFEIDSNQGHGVVIRSTEQADFDDGSTSYYKTIYWHLCDGDKEPQFTSPITATDYTGPGQAVKAGDIIGYADNTGLSTGDHLHFSVKPIAPGEYPGTWDNVLQTNGYLGCIDAAPYFNGFFAENAQAVLANLNQQLSLAQKALALLKAWFNK